MESFAFGKEENYTFVTTKVNRQRKTDNRYPEFI